VHRSEPHHPRSQKGTALMPIHAKNWNAGPQPRNGPFHSDPESFAEKSGLHLSPLNDRSLLLHPMSEGTRGNFSHMPMFPHPFSHPGQPCFKDSAISDKHLLPPLPAFPWRCPHRPTRLVGPLTAHPCEEITLGCPGPKGFLPFSSFSICDRNRSGTPNNQYQPQLPNLRP